MKTDSQNDLRAPSVSVFHPIGCNGPCASQDIAYLGPVAECDRPFRVDPHTTVQTCNQPPVRCGCWWSSHIFHHPKCVPVHAPTCACCARVLFTSPGPTSYVSHMSHHLNHEQMLHAKNSRCAAFREAGRPSARGAAPCSEVRGAQHRAPALLQELCGQL